MRRHHHTERQRRLARDPKRETEPAQPAPPPLVPVTAVWRLDLAGQRLVRHGRALPLTALLFRLLDHLVRHPNVVQTRAHLLDAVWGGDVERTERVVDQAICELRQLIEPDPAHTRYLRTRRGAGYWYQPPRPSLSRHAHRTPAGDVSET